MQSFVRMFNCLIRTKPMGEAETSNQTQIGQGVNHDTLVPKSSGFEPYCDGTRESVND